MKVLVLSDSHGRVSNMAAAIERESDCSLVFFLGDGLADAEKCMDRFPEKSFIAVKGNCDSGYAYDDTAYKYIEKNTIVACHGHRFSVKITLSDLLAHTKGVLGNIAFYGHTHKQDFHYERGWDVFVLNPGSIGMGNYAVAEITPKGIDAEFKNIFANK